MVRAARNASAEVRAKKVPYAPGGWKVFKEASKTEWKASVYGEPKEVGWG